MFERLQASAQRRADRLLLHVIARLAARPVPPDVEIKAAPDGIQLTGRQLKRRMIDDPALRNIGQ